MKLEIFRTLWGYTASHSSALDELLVAGFDGIEARLPLQANARGEFGAFLRSNHVPYICTLFSAYDVLPDQRATPAQHLVDIDRKLGWATELTPVSSICLRAMIAGLWRSRSSSSVRPWNWPPGTGCSAVSRLTAPAPCTALG